MNRRFALIGCALLLPAALAPAFAADEKLPSAESLMDRFIQVTGGKAAYEKHKSSIQHGHMDFAALGIKGTLVIYKSAPNKYYSSADLEGIGKLETGVSGDVAWENSPLTGPRIKTGEEKVEAIRDATVNSSYHWRDLYTKAETTGTAAVDGDECYEVTLTPGEGKPVKMYFSKKSGLLRKTSLIAASQLGDIPAELDAQEYKQFGGILTPVKIVQKAAGQEFTVVIDSEEENPEIPESRFDLPAEIKALLPK